MPRRGFGLAACYHWQITTLAILKGRIRRRTLSAAILHTLLLLPPCLAQGVITTVAGSPRVFRGDGAPAATVNLGEVQGVAVDSNGNVYASDGNNRRVVRISPAGVLTTFAGNGIAAFSGDGGPATVASLKNPAGLATDAAGNLYIVDAENSRVRKVTSAGIITTVAGGGSDVRADGVPATSAALSPLGVAVDATGNIYIADTYHHRIRKVTPAGTITTLAGTGVEGFSGDDGPATAASLNT
ncbi:MAG: hypothetical protein ACREUU_02725, partial [Gammaproteobacteria bacterium]